MDVAAERMFYHRTDDASSFGSTSQLEPATPTTVSVPRPSRCPVGEILPGRLSVQHPSDTYRSDPRNVEAGSPETTDLLNGGHPEMENQEGIFAGIGCISSGLFLTPEGTSRNGESGKMYGRA